MKRIDDWLDAQPLTSERLDLEPLRVEHADEMAPLLGDPELHRFIGGNPATLGELRHRYDRQVVGHSPGGSEHWLNWVARRRDSGRAVGTVQATIREQDGRLVADIAWVVGTSQQHQGFAREAARTMVTWLRQQGVEVLIAHVHPQHEASMAVARAAGLTPTESIVDGEIRWQD